MHFLGSFSMPSSLCFSKSSFGMFTRRIQFVYRLAHSLVSIMLWNEIFASLQPWQDLAVASTYFVVISIWGKTLTSLFIHSLVSDIPPGRTLNFFLLFRGNRMSLLEQTTCQSQVHSVLSDPSAFAHSVPWAKKESSSKDALPTHYQPANILFLPLSPSLFRTL